MAMYQLNGSTVNQRTTKGRKEMKTAIDWNDYSRNFLKVNNRYSWIGCIGHGLLIIAWVIFWKLGMDLYTWISAYSAGAFLMLWGMTNILETLTNHYTKLIAEEGAQDE